MPVVVTRPVVGAAAAVIAENRRVGVPDALDAVNLRVLLKNTTGSAPVFIGGEGVTDANGFEWEVADGPLEIDLEPGEKLYGIRAGAAADQTLHVLAQGR